MAGITRSALRSPIHGRARRVRRAARRPIGRYFFVRDYFFLTMTANDPVAVLPAASVALPETDVHVTGLTPSTASSALAVNATGAPEALVASTTRDEGTVSIGAATSGTGTGAFTS